MLKENAMKRKLHLCGVEYNSPLGIASKQTTYHLLSVFYIQGTFWDFYLILFPYLCAPIWILNSHQNMSRRATSPRQ